MATNDEWCTLGDSCTTPTDNTQRKEIKVKLPSLLYQINLKPDGNKLLTPLDIPDFDEIKNNSSSNTEIIEFIILNRKKPADTVSIKVFHEDTLIYTEPNSSQFLPSGEHIWKWDGYSSDGILDTRILKSKNLKIVLTATQDNERQVITINLKNKAEQVEWTDARIDRNSKIVELTVRPSFSNGGVEGKKEGEGEENNTPYSELLSMAASGIEFYWTRNGQRANGVDAPIRTPKGTYKAIVKADANAEPKAQNFPLIAKLDRNFGRATSLGGFRKIYHNLGFWGNRKTFADEHFKHTSAHEFGHLILNEYGGGWPVPSYSWGHKGSSTVATQTPIENHDIPKSGEIDLMEYHSNNPSNYVDFWARSVAHEQDVKGLIWLTRIQFNE